MAANPTYWPDNVSFKRFLRELNRKINYVPPFQQPIPSAETPGERESAPQAMRLGAWVLEVTDAGDLIARNDNGQVTLLAQAQASEGDHG